MFSPSTSRNVSAARPPSEPGPLGGVAQLGARPAPWRPRRRGPSAARSSRARRAAARDRGHVVDGPRERLLVGLRRLREAADLAHVLQRRRLDLVVGRRRLEVVEGADVPAHGCRVGDGAARARSRVPARCALPSAPSSSPRPPRPSPSSRAPRGRRRDHGARERRQALRARREERRAAWRCCAAARTVARRPRRPLRQQDLPRPQARAPATRVRAAASARSTRRLPRPAPGEQPGAVVLPQQTLKRGPQLREDARRRRARDDRPAARRARRSPTARSRPSSSTRATRPPRRTTCSRRSSARSPAAAPDDPLAPADLDRGRLADRAAARLRRRQRADARLGLLRRRLRPVRPADDLRRLRRGRDRRRADLGQGRQGRHGRHLLLRASPSSSPPAPGRRTSRRSRRCRSPTTSTPAPASRAASSTTGFALVLDQRAHGRRAARARRAASPGAQGARRRPGDDALHAPTRSCACRPRTRSAQIEAQPVPRRRRSSTTARPARGWSTIKVPTFLVGQFQDEQTGGHFPRAWRALKNNPKRLALAAERRPRRLARARARSPAGPSSSKLYVADEIPVVPPPSSA